MYEHNQDLNSKFELAFDKESRKKTKILRGLYGIIGITQWISGNKRIFFHEFVLPEENYNSGREAYKSGIFSKELEIEDCGFLEFILSETEAKRKGKRRGFNPRFSTPLIATEWGGESIPEVRSRLKRLCGIVCHVYGPRYSPYRVDGEPEAIYHDGWFIPQNKVDVARRLVKREEFEDSRFRLVG